MVDLMVAWSNSVCMARMASLACKRWVVIVKACHEVRLPPCTGRHRNRIALFTGEQNYAANGMIQNSRSDPCAHSAINELLVKTNFGGVMMTSSQLLEILNLCKEMDIVASKIYTKIAKMQSGYGEQTFWKTMAKEEREHVLFWKRAIAFCHENTVPDIFYDMGEVASDLNSSLKKALALYDSINTNCNESNYFLTAYWMEFYLLYPSFITIFHYMGILSVDGNPEHEYEQHLIGFVDGFSKYGRSTPEMELLGSLLHNLWRRNKDLVNSSMYDGLTQLMNRK